MPPNPDPAPCQCRCQCKPHFRAQCRSSTALALAFGMGAMTLGGAAMVAGFATPAVANACAANPCAVCDPCAPCAAMACAACAPCSAMDCAACDPCAPCGPCGACDPCAAGEGDATGCFVPRLQEDAANPCAADPCGACAPAACDPCAAMDCAADPCAANPCAAEPCAANACVANPCAVCDPCAPCAAMDCAACGPCAAGGPPPEVSDEELQALYDCMIEMTEAMEAGEESQAILASWSESGREEGGAFRNWTNFASTPYISFTHGERFATNHANPIAAEVYGLYEDIDAMPVGGIVAKPTFSIGDDGQAYWETLFLMEKAEAGASPDTNDWIYTAIMPDGSLMGRTLGENSDGMYFCAACHMGSSDGTDDLLFMEEQYRVQN